MSVLTFRDSFSDLRNWTGSGSIDTTNVFSSPSSVDAGILITKKSFFDVSRMEIQFYDTGGDFYLLLGLGGHDIIKITANPNFYAVTESGTDYDTPIARSIGWKKIRIELQSNYVVYIGDDLAYVSVGQVRRGFDITISGGIWDNLLIERDYEDDYLGGTGGGKEDLEVKEVTITPEDEAQYTLTPGYFYVDNIEYYYFANMAQIDFTPNPSGQTIYASGLPYIPGQPYFVVPDENISPSGYVKTPIVRDYFVSWYEHANGGYQPWISGAYDSKLVFEVGEQRLFTLPEPTRSFHIVLSDEGGTAAKIRSNSSYIDYAKVGDTYQAYAEVTDKYGGPVPGAVVTWKKIDGSNTITDVGSTITDDNGIAFTSIVIFETGELHIYAETNPISQPRWIQIPIVVADIRGTVFQLNENSIWLDCMQARMAQGYNIWGEEWGSNPGEPTGLTSPNPTTHGQWEAAHPELRRPPEGFTNSPANEPNGWWSGMDFRDAYPSIVAAAGGLELFMNPKYVARRGNWGTSLISGADIRTDAVIASGQVLNHSTIYEIDRDYGATFGSYDTVRAGGGAYDSVFYVFYQRGNAYVGNSPDPAGIYFFRGVAVYDETLSQANSRVQDIISNGALQQ